MVFAWIVYKSRAHRDRVNAKVLEGPAHHENGSEAYMPVDTKRMAYGGFKVFVEA